MSLCLERPERKIASHEFLSLGWDMVSHVVYGSHGMLGLAK